MLDLSIRHTAGAAFTLDVQVTTSRPRLGVFGASGAGKSLLLGCIAGMVRHIGGHVRYGDAVWEDTGAGIRVPLRRRRVGYMTQDALLFPHRTVEQNLRYSPAAQSAGGRFADVVAALGLEPLLTRMPRNLSGGEQQRVALGRALLSDPALLLLDEPFAGLDAASRRAATALLDRVHTQFGVPWIVVSHDGADLVALADEVLVLDGGRVAAQGAPLECMAVHAANPQALAHGIDNLLRGPTENVANGDGLAELQWGGRRILVPAPGTPGADATYGCFANSLVLSLAEPAQQSARNHVPARVAALHPVGAECVIMLEIGAATLRALVLERTVADMGLHPGAHVWVSLKTTSLSLLT